MLKRSIYCTIAPILLAMTGTVAVSPHAFAQAIRVNGGAQTLTVTTASPGSEPLPVTNTTSSLRYTRQSKISKITVSTSCPGQNFNLTVVATNVTQGTAAPPVSLINGNPALDFVTNIPRSGFTNATCTLFYTASATFSQGNSSELGNDTHTITYTLQVQ